MYQDIITVEDFSLVKEYIRKWWYVISLPTNPYDVQYDNMHYMVNKLLSGHARVDEVLYDLPHDLLQRLHYSNCL